MFSPNCSRSFSQRPPLLCIVEARQMKSVFIDGQEDPDLMEAIPGFLMQG